MHYVFISIIIPYAGIHKRVLALIHNKKYHMPWVSKSNAGYTRKLCFFHTILCSTSWCPSSMVTSYYCIVCVCGREFVEKGSWKGKGACAIIGPSSSWEGSIWWKKGTTTAILEIIHFTHMKGKYFLHNNICWAVVLVYISAAEEVIRWWVYILFI